MKRFTGMFLVLAFILAGTFAMATPAITLSSDNEPKIRSEALDSKTIKIQLVNLEQETTTVKLENFSGTEYYKRTIKNHNGFARKLDLNDLDNGRYMLKVEQGDQEWVQVVYVDNNTIRLSSVVSK